MTLADAARIEGVRVAPRAAMTPTALEFTRPPAALLIEPQIRAALEEDLGRAGDITSELTIPADQKAAGQTGGAQTWPHRRTDRRRNRLPAGRSVIDV